ncbi:MAG: metalloregulator ArsR/SmtB family transcription factor [bacterium]|nr:metalloregulator ArsR/SmtB family transcription factor [bacterium]
MEIVSLFKSLADETRVRLLNLLLNHELNVNEIVAVMEMGQSRISRHLKILTDNGILTSRRDGLWIFYKALLDDTVDEENRFFSALADFIRENSDLKADLARLEVVLEERENEKSRFFDSIAINWDDLKNNLIGDYDLTGAIVSRVPESAVVADLGCGTGELLYAVRNRAQNLIGVDKSPKMLGEAKRRFTEEGLSVDLRIGELEHLPMRDREADCAIFNMVLHHLASPFQVITEGHRVLKKGSPLLIVDLAKHSNEEMRSKYGHRWLGFTEDEISEWLSKAGFRPENKEHINIQKGLTISIYFSVKE